MSTRTGGRLLIRDVDRSQKERRELKADLGEDRPLKAQGAIGETLPSPPPLAGTSAATVQGWNVA